MVSAGAKLAPGSVWNNAVTRRSGSKSCTQAARPRSSSCAPVLRICRVSGPQAELAARVGRGAPLIAERELVTQQTRKPLQSTSRSSIVDRNPPDLGVVVRRNSLRLASSCRNIIAETLPVALRRSRYPSDNAPPLATWDLDHSAASGFPRAVASVIAELRLAGASPDTESGVEPDLASITRSSLHSMSMCLKQNAARSFT